METIKCDSEACKTHTHKKLLGTRLHLSHEYSYVHKIMLISKYFCKNEYINIDIVCIKRNFLTQIEKKELFLHISAVKQNLCWKKSHLTVVHQAQYQNSIVFTPQLRANLTVCQVYLFASVRMLKRTWHRPLNHWCYQGGMFKTI